LQLWIEDDGNGFDSDNVKRGFGLSSMKSRIEAINGEFSMTSTNGVSIYINTPL
jgi:signal transduction histidine kinase